MRNAFYLVLLGVILVTIAIVVRSGVLMRKNPGEPINSAMRAALTPAVLPWPESDLPLLAQHYAGAHETPSGLRYLVRTPGTGDSTPARGQLVTVNYEGRLLDGTKFDASADHGGPFHFLVGESRVISGWDEALLTMKKGERRTLIIPYWLAYGEKGIKGKIPPRATLVFDVELLQFEPNPGKK